MHLPSHFAVRWDYLVVGPNDLCRIPFSLPTLLAFSHEFPILVLDLCCSVVFAPDERLQQVKNQPAAVRRNAFIWIFAALLVHSPVFDCPRFLHGDRVYLLIKQTGSSSVLGPVLFLVYINDLEEGVTGKILKFADDTKLFRKVKEIGDKQNLQDDIDKLVKWSEKWQMLFNFGKCKWAGKYGHEL